MCSDLDEHVLEIEFGPDTRAAGDVRHAVAPWLTERSFPGALLGDLLVVVSELVTNAVVHTAAPGRVTVRWDGRDRLEEGGRPRFGVVDLDDGAPAVPADGDPPRLAGVHDGVRDELGHDDEQVPEQFGRERPLAQPRRDRPPHVTGGPGVGTELDLQHVLVHAAAHGNDAAGPGPRWSRPVGGP